MDGKQEAVAPLSFSQRGLQGRRALVLFDEPTDEVDWPADLPAGTKAVVILDDTPNAHHTLRVHPAGDPGRVALVVYDQLGLDASSAVPPGEHVAGDDLLDKGQ